MNDAPRLICLRHRNRVVPHPTVLLLERLMHLTTRNVNTAFRELVKVFDSNGMENGRGNDLDPGVIIVRRPSRNGSVLMIDEPVMVTYTHPRERVLFNAARDANPFFGLYEQLWMLAGRNDVAPLAYYAKQMNEYSDDGKTLNGAYGHRWRHSMVFCPGDDQPPNTVDQLDVIINHLKADPNSRRAVLQMWNVEDDLLKIDQVEKGHRPINESCPLNDPEIHCNPVVAGLSCTCEPDVVKPSKDVCCNLSVMFSLRKEHNVAMPTYRWKEEDVTYLDMTVTNRSNDMVWGMLGQDYVTFSILQEYMAARLGAEVGRYHHFTNNLHVYDEPDKVGIPKWQPDKWLESPAADENIYDVLMKTYVPLVQDFTVFDQEVNEFAEMYKDGEAENSLERQWREPFLDKVAAPMMEAFHSHKCGTPKEAMLFASCIKADDWRIAATNWLQRRVK